MIISFIMEIIVSFKFFGNGLEEVNRGKNVIFDFFEIIRWKKCIGWEVEAVPIFGWRPWAAPGNEFQPNMDILWWALLKILIAEGKWKFSTHLSILTKSPSFPERNFDLAKFLKVRMDRLVVVAFFVLLEEKFLVKNCHLTGIWHFYNVWRRFTIFTIPSEALKVPLTKVFWLVIWEKFLFSLPGHKHQAVNYFLFCKLLHSRIFEWLCRCKYIFWRASLLL